MKIWQYRLQDPGHRLGGWAHVIIRQDGFFATVSDFGDYAHGFWRHGLGDFREFFRGGVEVDYMCSKLGRKDDFDKDATIRHIKETIVYLRRECWWSAEKARAEWDLVVAFDRGDFGPEGWMAETRIEEAYDDLRYAYPSMLRRWCELFLPLLAAAVEAELAAEAA